MNLQSNVAVALVLLATPATAGPQAATRPDHLPSDSSRLAAVEQLIQQEPLPLETLQPFGRPVKAPAASCIQLLQPDSAASAATFCSACVEAAKSPKLRDELRQHLAANADACRQVMTCLDKNSRGAGPLALLPVLPTRPEVVSEIEDLYFYQLERSAASDEWLAQVEEWLAATDSGHVKRLAAEAGKLRVKETWIEGDRQLQALARLDWASAAPIVEKAVASPEPTLQALGLLVELTSRPDLAAERKDQLLLAARRIAEDTGVTGRARDLAFEALLRAEWPGQEQWLVARFSEPGISKVRSGHTVFAPLCNATELDPERWIPVLARLIGSSNRVEHDNAVHCLAQLNLDSARADALQPLLPWLSDPEWATEIVAAPKNRLRLVQSLDRVDLPESVPGLIWVAEHDTGYALEAAADALARYGATEAVPALREALAREPDHRHRAAVISALVKLEGLPAEARADGVLAMLRLMEAPDGPETLRKWLYGFGNDRPIQPPEISIGMVTSSGTGADRAVADMLLARMAELETEEPAVARRLEAVLASWKLEMVDEVMLHRLAAGTLGAEALSYLLRNADHLRASASNRLVDIVTSAGAAAGVAAVLLGDDATLNYILGKDDQQATRALLAAARHLRAQLPLEAIGRLLDDPQQRDLAASYLEALDSAEARELLLASSATGPRILGARTERDPGHFTFEVFDAIEDSMLELLASPDGPDEIIALLSAGYWGDDGQRVIFVADDGAELHLQPHPTMIRSRPLAAEELDQVRRFIATRAVDSLAPYTPMAFDGMQYEYVHLTGNGGVRVFMNNPEVDPDGDVYGRLVALFYELGSTGTFRSRYALVDATPGAEILYDGDLVVRTVCGDEHGVAALVGSSEDGGSWTWRRVNDGGLGDATEAPAPCKDLPDPGFAPLDMELDDDLETQPAAVRSCSAGVVVQGTWNGRTGLWLASESTTPTLVDEGEFELAVVTPDCRWVVAAKSEEENLMLFDLEKKTRSEIDRSEDLDPWMVLPDTQEIYLICDGDCTDLVLDPATGSTRPVPATEQFLPQPERALQPAGSPHLYWLAVVDFDTGATEIGVFDTRDLSFEGRHVLQYIALAPHQVWIDAAKGRTYLATGDLLSVPWPPQGGGSSGSTEPR